MPRGDGRTAPTNIDQWRQRLAEAEDRNEELEQENEDLRARLDEIGAIAAPEAREELQAVRDRLTKMDGQLEMLVALFKQESGKLIEMPSSGGGT